MDADHLEIIAQRRLRLQKEAYELVVCQTPLNARALPKLEKTRGAKWPLDPPPVLEFFVHDDDQFRSYLHSPFWFCTAELEHVAQNRASSALGQALTGSLVSSLHRTKTTDNKEHGFFVFGDLNVKHVGTYRLKFTLYEMRSSSSDGMCAQKLNHVYSGQFQVHSHKTALPIKESTTLSKHLADAGVKLRIRKEPPKRKSHQQTDWTSDKRPFGMPTLPLPFPSFTNGDQPQQAVSREGITSNGTNYAGLGDYVAHRFTYGGEGIKSAMNTAQLPLPSLQMQHHQQRLPQPQWQNGSGNDYVPSYYTQPAPPPYGPNGTYPNHLFDL